MDKIRHYAKKSKNWWSTKSTGVKVVIIGAVVVLVLILLRLGSSNENTAIEIVKRADVVRTVSASGTVVSSTDLALSFEQSKVVDSVRVKVGDTVKKGDILATLKSGTERASYTSARGSYLAAQARYKKVLDGSSNEEIALAQINLETTKKVQNGLVEQARRKLFSDGLIAEAQSASISNNPVISGVYNGTLEGEYRLSFTNSSKLKLNFTGLEKGETDVDDLARPLGTKGLLIAFPLDKSQYPSDARWNVLIPNKNGSNYASNLNAYQSAVETRDAMIATREAELNLKRATARQADVDAALADIVTAQASLESANAALERTILRAPADGTITQIDIKVGEVPEAFSTAIILQDVSNLYLEANVNESYVGQLAVGQYVNVTFDALPGVQYRGTVSSVDPAATVTDSIVNYKVKALLLGAEEIRPGMTADMVITTGSATAVLTLPGRVINKNDTGAAFVDVVTDPRRSKTEERAVTIGLTGDGDVVEVTSGVTEGETVLWNAE
ncbi:MAG TPA: efflux RND transporter periplasmic adaptor subunit [Candidatus Paceibacterota bacterium]